MDKKLDLQLLALKNNAIFQLSMTSKELFHSNFLYWLGTTESLKSYFKAVICDLCGSKKIDWNEDKYLVLREHECLDFCICKDAGKNRNGNQKIGDIFFVLENKFKSIATESQLNRYAEKCEDPEGKHITYTLLSLAEDFSERASIEQGKVWNIVSYQEYAAILKEHLDLVPSEGDGFIKLLIENYIGFIDTFAKGLNDELTKAFENLDNKKWEDIICNPMFEDLRCNDIWQKVVMHKMAQILASKVTGHALDFRGNDDNTIFKDNVNGKKIYIGVNLLHGQALLGISYRTKDGHIFTLQQQGTDKLRTGIIVENRQSIGNERKPNPNKLPKDHAKWRDNITSFVRKLGLSEYIQPYKMPRYKELTYGVFDNSGTSSFYYGKKNNDLTVKETLDYMVDVINSVASKNI